jgi:hypothetical protein
MTMQTKGFGAARKPADTPCIPPRKISDQLMPVLNAGRGNDNAVSKGGARK